MFMSVMVQILHEVKDEMNDENICTLIYNEKHSVILFYKTSKVYFRHFIKININNNI